MTAGIWFFLFQWSSVAPPERTCPTQVSKQAFACHLPTLATGGACCTEPQQRNLGEPGDGNSNWLSQLRQWQLTFWGASPTSPTTLVTSVDFGVGMCGGERAAGSLRWCLVRNWATCFRSFVCWRGEQKTPVGGSRA